MLELVTTLLETVAVVLTMVGTGILVAVLVGGPAGIGAGLLAAAIIAGGASALIQATHRPETQRGEAA